MMAFAVPAFGPPLPPEFPAVLVFVVGIIFQLLA